MHNPKDKRKERTKNYLIEALVSLMYKKSLHGITVKELCSEAQINRSTFYSNYIDLNDFLAQIMKEKAAGLVLAVTDDHRNSDILLRRGEANSRYYKWFSHVNENADFFNVMLGKNGTSNFYDLLLKQGICWYTELLRTAMPKFENEVSLDILVNYIVSAHIGLLMFYLHSNKKYSCKYMANQLTFLTFSGPMSILHILE